MGFLLADSVVDGDIGDVDHFVASSQRCFGSDEQYQLSTLDVLESDRSIALDHQLAAKKRTGLSGLGLEIGPEAIALATMESRVNLLFYWVSCGFLAGLCHGQHSTLVFL
ncbi:hypothetical protein A5320_04070 [Rheinheimera sp. SA_1]|uniref:hypothetical protein n=1 Tax=Rheinheimera sp. SA_1 TaxID=1827365 RepID=UPI0007FFEB04|nr:hypothetical protein [Rheinheimera sp. SA_1]OBP16581.1 hypothetical protein A5320_04070 [Rheinheimera sp. SA_1]